jgi:hypothetical protein
MNICNYNYSKMKSPAIAGIFFDDWQAQRLTTPFFQAEKFIANAGCGWM